MLSRCANPECGAPFDYRQGQLFRFPLVHSVADYSGNTHSVRHFWLCGSCSQTYTLRYVSGEGIAIASRPPLAAVHSPRLISAA